MQLIAVVTINRNNPVEVLDIFNSLKKQDYQNWIFIVVDDNSDDLSPLNDVKDSRFVVVSFPPPFAFAYAKKFNFAFRQAIPYDPKYILKLHTDMSISSDHLIASLIEPMELNETIACVGPKIFDGNNIQTWGPGIVKRRIGHEFSVHECYMVRTSYLTEHDGFQDEIFTWYGEEMDFFARIYRAGFNTAQVNESIIHFGGATSAGFAIKKRYYRAKSTLLFIYKQNRHYSFYRNLRWYIEENSSDFLAGFKLVKEAKLAPAALTFYYMFIGLFSALYLILSGRIRRL